MKIAKFLSIAVAMAFVLSAVGCGGTRRNDGCPSSDSCPTDSCPTDRCLQRLSPDNLQRLRNSCRCMRAQLQIHRHGGRLYPDRS